LPTTSRSEGLPHETMTMQLTEPPEGRAEAHSEPVLTHRFC
jgi:hypothetical protein